MATWPTWTNKFFLSLHGRMVGLFRHAITANSAGNAETFPESFMGGDGFHDVLRSTAGGITATGSTQAGAVMLGAVVNQVATAAASSGVQLPVMIPGMRVAIANDGSNALTVYPNVNDSGAKIDGGNTATVTNAKRAVFDCINTGTIVSYGMTKSA